MPPNRRRDFVTVAISDGAISLDTLMMLNFIPEYKWVISFFCIPKNNTTAYDKWWKYYILFLEMSMSASRVMILQSPWRIVSQTNPSQIILLWFSCGRLDQPPWRTAVKATGDQIFPLPDPSDEPAKWNACRKKLMGRKSSSHHLFLCNE